MGCVGAVSIRSDTHRLANVLRVAADLQMQGNSLFVYVTAGEQTTTLMASCEAVEIWILFGNL